MEYLSKRKRGVERGIERGLHEAADFANANYDVSGLCRELNWRLEQLVKVTLGDRLKK